MEYPHTHRIRLGEILNLGRRLHVVALNKLGEPWPGHPLYLPKDRKPMEWTP